MMLKIKKSTLLVILILFSFTISSRSSDTSHGEEFNAGHFILHHVVDSYEWYLFGDISIPLPVILYSKNNGFDVFLSYNISHGKIYNGYQIATTGPLLGKLIEIETGKKPLIDISITKNVLEILIVIFLMLFIFLKIGKMYKQNSLKAPQGIQSFFEPVIVFIRDEVSKSVIGCKHERFTPFLLTVFFFILFSNIIGLFPTFPGGGNITGDISVTFVLALFTFLITTISGNRNYWKHIFNTPGVPWWLKYPIPIMPIIEMFGMISKPATLMIRLFANVMAGHIIVVSFVSLIFILSKLSDIAGYAGAAVAVPFLVFMIFLELLVSFIQAYIFTLLSAVYFSLAVQDDH